MSILVKRGTRAQLNTAASRGELTNGEPLFITDEQRFAVATSATTYETFLKQGEQAVRRPPVLFSAYLSANDAPGANNPLTQWTVVHNLGGGTFATGAYTIPITGWYRLQVSLMLNNNSTNGGLTFRVNTTNRLRIAYAGNPSVAYDMCGGEEYAQLTQGDVVRVITDTAVTWFGSTSPVGRWNIEYLYWQ